tara:strand:+ start:119 stop:619 length:501 start_codon:yes stop_codon:yes gene_type:complete
VNVKHKYIKLYQEMADLCEECGWGDPFSYARSKEIYAACVLGHRMPGPNDYSGADAINERGEEVEYKSTIGKSVKGSYTGISVQATWEEQDRYLREEKLAKYPEHFYNRFDGGKLVESWKLTGQQVYDILLPKLRRKYPTILQKKDPRLSADITTGDLKQHGTRIL